MTTHFQTLRSVLCKMRDDFATTALSRSSRVGVISAFVITVALILVGYDGCGCLFTGYDDSYITYRYAQNLATGKGLVFNVGDATDSASSFLYTILLALAHLVGLHDLPLAATVIGIACAACVAANVYLIGLERTRHPLLALFVAVTLGTHGLVSGWAVSGMETLLFMFLITLAVLRLFVRGALGWFEATLVIAALLARFEGLLLAAVWLALVLARFARVAQPERLSLIRQIAAVGGSFALFLSFKYWMYGTILPHAFALKTITRLYAPQPNALWNVWSSSAPALSVFAIAGLFSLPPRVESAAFVLYCVVSTVSLLLGPSADYARYSVHMLPIAAALASVPLVRLIRAQPVLGLAACWLIASQSYSSFQGMRSAVERGAEHSICRRQIGAFLERTLEPGTPVLSSDIGVIAYAAPSITFIDAVGLTSKDVLEARKRGESVDPVLLARKPLFIADTCHGSCTTPEEFSTYGWLSQQAYWKTRMPRHEYSSLMQNGRLLERCQTTDGFAFGVARFELRSPTVRTP